jgi:hypothetical protein
MTATKLTVVPRVEGWFYDGTNGADIVAQQPALVTDIGSTYVLSVKAGQLVATITNNNLPVPPYDNVMAVNSWVILTEQAYYGNLSTASWNQTRVQISPTGPAVPTSALGITNVPSINAGANATVDVTIKPTLPNTSYNPGAALIGSTTILGQLSVTSATLLNTSTVRVVVHNGALLTVTGGQLFAMAVQA